MLNRIEATALLDWAHAQTPGPWRAHSLHVARAAGAILEKRLVDVALRHGLEPGLDEKWRAFLNLRRDFERRMGASVYSLFDECAAVTFAAEG